MVQASDDVGMNETLASNGTSHVVSDVATGNQTSDEGNQTPGENNQTPAENVTIPKIKTKVQADQKAAIYKKNSYFIIKLKDKKNVFLNNVKLKVKVESGKTVKTFNIKTNSKGVAKFNTKGLKIGVHKVSITSDENYTVSKTSKLFVGKRYKAVLRFRHVKILKNKEIIKFKVKYDNDFGKEVTIAFKKKSLHTKILKAKFIFYHQKGKKFVSKIEYSKFKNGKWYWPDKDYSFRYLIYKAEVFYISTKSR
ncbi:hypothetical protein [Methanobrevibacter sp.]|uniref:hypothetical protein n=1 Tax=Methanobrevibacter sp. TaxID=66852 RepID=UPI003870B78D